MKKPYKTLAFLSVLFLDAAGAARADGPYMITFPSFCDCITLRTTESGGTKWIYGTWDWLCDGSFVSIGGGRDGFTFGTNPTVPFDAGLAATFDLAGGLFSLAATRDGISNILLQVDQPYTITVGSCPPHAGNNSQPPLVPR